MASRTSVRPAVLWLAAAGLALAGPLAWWLYGRDAGTPERADTPGATGAAAPDADTGPGARPNVLWIVWDTVRADRMSLYGAERETTPHLDEWARDARVYEDAVSVAHSTLPAHASMLTGKLAVQHATHYGHAWLGDAHTTLPESLRQAGYRTFLWSSNPHVSAETNLAQGFEAVAHPWDDARRERALEIVRDKVAPDRGSGMDRVVAQDDVNEWAIKAAGELAEPALARWLEQGDGEAPWLAVLNYMEAHRVYVPPRRFRARFLSESQVERSYEIDNTWPKVWAYTFGLEDYPEGDLEIVRGVYDACIAELDALLHSLLTSLDEAGRLEDTVVMLTADHGEHLGEKHMLDHQYTLHEPVLRVPLVIRYPERVEPGRERAPVSNLDLYRTVLELTRVTPPEGLVSPAASLLAPEPERPRLAEHPAAHRPPIDLVQQAHPDWDPSEWLTPMAALYRPPYKLIWRQKGESELYDLSSDPSERHDLSDDEPERTERMIRHLRSALGRYAKARRHAPEPPPDVSDAQKDRLRALGYAQ